MYNQFIFFSLNIPVHCLTDSLYKTIIFFILTLYSDKSCKVNNILLRQNFLNLSWCPHSHDHLVYLSGLFFLSLLFCLFFVVLFFNWQGLGECSLY